MSEEAKCQSIFENLIACNLSRDQNTLASAYIREFQESKRCDKFYSFEKDRKDLEMRINSNDPKRMERIINFKQTLEDEMHCSQAVIHYGTWHTKQLVSALNWSNWIKYHTIDRAERTVAVLGIFGATYAGLRVGRTSLRYIREQMNMKGTTVKSTNSK